MEELIATYLFQNKKCPLPRVGTLSIETRASSFILGERMIYPPIPFISFSTTENSTDDFINFVSLQRDISTTEALQGLDDFCSKLNSLESFSEYELPFAGKFFVDAEGSLVFKQFYFQEAFLYPVPAERVMHPESSHPLIVGDKESNSALMAEFYNVSEPEKKSRWWVWALLLFLIAATVIGIFINDNGIETFGNAKKFPVQREAPAYTTPQ